MKLFKRALIYDGTGSEPFKGDILVENDKIVKVAISIEPGYYADLTVFDEAELRDGKPAQDKSFGIEQVYINGIKVLDGDMLDAEAIRHSGRAMRVL